MPEVGGPLSGTFFCLLPVQEMCSRPPASAQIPQQRPKSQPPPSSCQHGQQRPKSPPPVQKISSPPPLSSCQHSQQRPKVQPPVEEMRSPLPLSSRLHSLQRPKSQLLVQELSSSGRPASWSLSSTPYPLNARAEPQRQLSAAATVSNSHDCLIGVGRKTLKQHTQGW